MDLRIVDVQNGRVVFSGRGSGGKSSVNIRIFDLGGDGEKRQQKNQTTAMRSAIKKLVKKINKAGLNKSFVSTTVANVHTVPVGAVLIAHIAGESITLNKRQRAGLMAGQKFVIQRNIGETKDPASGKVIKLHYQPIGELQIVSVAAHYPK